ncbi:MAG: sensor histidine kinase, partial [Acidobacteria bacterium]|nr:sensor histidine kinase [Acidobacteriota bacterium]
LAADLEHTDLLPWQKDRIVKNFTLRFAEFREITLFGLDGHVMVTSRVSGPKVSPPAPGTTLAGGIFMSPVRVDDDLLPTSVLAVPLKELGEQTGWLVGEVSLEEMWRLVDRIRIGRRGFALVVAPGGELLAHGDPNEKPRVAKGEKLLDHPVVEHISASTASGSKDGVIRVDYTRPDGTQMLAVGSRMVDAPGWTVIVEQPNEEAYAVTTRLEYELWVAILLALTGMLIAGYFWGRALITPIVDLIRGTRALAQGRLDERVHPQGAAEFRELGEAFNTMAGRLVAPQDDTRTKERQAMFGRIAAGLVHDLGHPVKNLANNCRVIMQMHDDPEYRETFRRTTEREITAMKRLLDDLHDLGKPTSLARSHLDVNRSLADVVESMRARAEEAQISLDAKLSPNPLYIDGDALALGRVYRNLIVNAIEATTAGGRIDVACERRGEHVVIRVTDTGCGIAAERLTEVFEDLVTTKRRGLGLGLAICKKIVEQLDGTITITSRVGEGTTFTLRFPAIREEVRKVAS